MSDPDKPQQAAKTFAEEASKDNPSLLSEFWDLVLHEKKWWLIPIIVVLLAIGLLVVLGSSAVAPFIYPLF